MSTSIPFSRSVPWIFPLLLLALGCGESPTSAPGSVATEPTLSSHAPDNPNALRAWDVVATAEFYAVEECRETESSLTATRTGGADGVATVDFTYSVFGVCGDGEGLWVYDLYSYGPIPIDPADFRVHPGLRWAVLDTELIVEDEEAGTAVTVRIQARWERRQDGRDRVVVATLDVGGPYLSPQYLTNPISTFEAELTRSRR